MAQSDEAAVQAYISELKKNGKGVPIRIKAPADIEVKEGKHTHYYEIKMTSKDKSYFGAATLTEWKQALNTPEFYHFVIAIHKKDDTYEFIKLTPDEFMKYSTIPPFKVNFNINLKDLKKIPKRRTAIPMNKDNMRDMLELFEKMHNGR